MKSILILISIIIALNGIYSQKSKISPLEKALNPNPNPNCKGDCRVLKKIQGIFPLRGEAKNIDTQLNFFNWKFFFVFSDHLSVYSASQNEPKDGKSESPQEVDFLDNFPIDDIQTPCNSYKDVCTVAEFREQVYKPLNLELIPNQKAMDAMGKEIWNNCFLLSQDLLENVEDMGYVCSKNLADFQSLLRILNENINKYEGKEFVGRLYMINDNHDDLTELNAHLNSELFVGNNVNDDIQTGSSKEGYKELFRFNLLNDIPSPAYTLLKENITIEWKGDDSKKPDTQRCFGLATLKKNKERKELIFCAFTTNNGSKSLDPPSSNLEAIEWVTKLNRKQRNQKIKTSQEFLKQISTSISSNDPRLDPAKNEIHDIATRVDKDCQEKVKSGILDQRNCDEMKMKVVAEKSAELCQGNKECLKAIKEAIKQGSIPLTNKGVDIAWSSDNPYKAATTTDTTKAASTTASADASQAASPAKETKSPSTSPLGDLLETEKKDANEADGTSGTSDETDSEGNKAGLNNFDKKIEANNAEGADKGENVVNTFGAEKAQDILSKDAAANGVGAATANPNEKEEQKKIDEKENKDGERLKGIISDVGLDQKELDKLKTEEAPTVVAEIGQPAPTKEEIQKAINTFKRIFYGRVVDKVEGVENYCVGSTLNIERAVALIPFLTFYDPFLDYLGHIRDVQSEKS